MRDIISALGSHDQFTVGFLDTGQKHFGAYNRGMLATGGAARIASQVVREHSSDDDIFGALTDFVRNVALLSVPVVPALLTASPAGNAML